MKRFVTILLVLAVLASMGSIAYAEESGSGSENFTEDGSSKTINIQGAFQPAGDPSAVYSVTIAWDSLKYNCTVNGQLSWNPSDHSYTNNRTFTWVAPEDTRSLLNPDIRFPEKNRTIRVTNDSNKDVYVKANAAVKSDNYGFQLAVTPSTVPVKNRADTTENTADFEVQIISPTKPVEEMKETNTYTIGTVTITVSPTNFDSP